MVLAMTAAYMILRFPNCSSSATAVCASAPSQMSKTNAVTKGVTAGPKTPNTASNALAA
jgi:hypothetical protein